MAAIEMEYYPEGTAYFVEAVVGMPSNGTNIDRIMETYEGLRTRERKILDLYFGLVKTSNFPAEGENGLGREVLNLREIGELLGITGGRVGQIKDKSISKMRKNLLGSKLE